MTILKLSDGEGLRSMLSDDAANGVSMGLESIGSKQK